MYLDRRIALFEAVAARWAFAARQSPRLDARGRDLRARSKALVALLAELKKARQTAADIAHRIDALLIESGADDAVAEREAA